MDIPLPLLRFFADAENDLRSVRAQLVDQRARLRLSIGAELPVGERMQRGHRLVAASEVGERDRAVVARLNRERPGRSK